MVLGAKKIWKGSWVGAKTGIFRFSQDWLVMRHGSHIGHLALGML